MAIVNSLSGTALLVQIGDGTLPTEVFAADCLINTDRGIQFASDENRQVIPDCDNPDDPAWQTLDKDGLTATITGAGMLHTTSVPDWSAWFAANTAKNCRVLLSGVAVGSGGGHWAGAFKLTSWEVTGARNARAEVSVTLGSDGPVTWVDAV